MYKKRIWIDGESVFTALSMNNIEEVIEKMSTDLAGLRVPTVDKSNFISNMKLGEKADIDHTHKDYAKVDHTHSFYQLLDKIDVPNPVLLVPVEEMDNYYTKTQTYSKAEVDAKILAAVTGGTVDLSVYYDKAEFDEIYVNIRGIIDKLATLNQSNAYIKLTDVYGKAAVDEKIAELTTKVNGYLKDYETKDQLYSIKEIDDLLNGIDTSTNNYVAVIELKDYADLQYTYGKTYIDNSLDEKAATDHIADHKATYVTVDDMSLKADKGHKETPIRIVFDDGDTLQEKYSKGTLVGGTKLETYVVDLFSDIAGVIDQTTFGDTVQTKGFRQLGLGAAKYRVLEIEELDTFRDQHGVKINYMGEIQITDVKKLRVIPDGGRLNPLQLGLRSFLLGYDSSILLQSTINRATYDNSIVDLSMCELTAHDVSLGDRTTLDGCGTGKIYLTKGYNVIFKIGHRSDQEKGLDSAYAMNMEFIGTRGIHGMTTDTNECGIYIYKGTRNKIRNCVFSGFNGAGVVMDESVNMEGSRVIESMFSDSVYGVVTKDNSIYNRLEQCTFSDVEHGIFVSTTGNVVDGCNLKNTDVTVYGDIEFGMFLNTGYSFNSSDENCNFRYVPHASNPSTMLFQGLSRIPNMITKARPGTVFSGVHFENISHIGADNQAVIANSFTTKESPRGASELFASVGFVDGSAEKEDIDVDAVFNNVPNRPAFHGVFTYHEPVTFGFNDESTSADDNYDNISKGSGDFVPSFANNALLIDNGDSYMFEKGISMDESKDTIILEMGIKRDNDSTSKNIELMASMMSNENNLIIEEYKPFIIPTITGERTQNFVWVGVNKNGGMQLFAIGHNNYGNLGLGHTRACIAATPVQFPHADRVVSIACGVTATHLVLDDGSVYAAGAGYLGHVDNARRTTFTKINVDHVDGKVVRAFNGTNDCSYILTDKNKLYAAGNNDYGRLGVGQPTSYKAGLFEEVQGLETMTKTIKDVFPTLLTVIVSYTDGTASSFGYNGGSIGLRTGGDTLAAVSCNIAGFNNIIEDGGIRKVVHCARYSMLVLTENGSLFGIGSNSNGQLGLPNTSFASQNVPLTRVYIDDVIDADENIINIFSVDGGDNSGFVTDKGRVFMTGILSNGVVNRIPDELRAQYIRYNAVDKFILCVQPKITLPIKHATQFIRGVMVCDGEDNMRVFGNYSVSGLNFLFKEENPTDMIPDGVAEEDVIKMWTIREFVDFVATKDKIYMRETANASETDNRYYSEFYHKSLSQGMTDVNRGSWVDCQVDFNPMDIHQVSSTAHGGSVILLKDGTVYEFSSGNTRPVRKRSDINEPVWRKAIIKSTNGENKIPAREFTPDQITTLDGSIGGINLSQGNSDAGGGMFFANGKIYTYGKNWFGESSCGESFAQTGFIRELTYDFGGTIVSGVKETDASMFLREDGAIFFIGNGSDYRHGNNATTSFTTVQQLNFEFPSKVVKIFAGIRNRFFLLENGEVYGCGLNSSGQLGTGNTNAARVPTKIPFEQQVKNIITADQFTLFITEVGIYGSGRKDFIGDGNTNVTTFKFMTDILNHRNIIKIQNSSVNILFTTTLNTFILGLNSDYICNGVNEGVIDSTLRRIPFGGQILLSAYGAIIVKTDKSLKFYGNKRRLSNTTNAADSNVFVRDEDISMKYPFPLTDDIEFIHANKSDFTNFFIWNKTQNKVYNLGNYFGTHTRRAGMDSTDSYNQVLTEALIHEARDEYIETATKIVSIQANSPNLNHTGYCFLMEDGGLLLCGGADDSVYVYDQSNVRWSKPTTKFLYLRDHGFEDKKIRSAGYSKAHTLMLVDETGDLYMCGYSYANQLGTTQNYTPNLTKYTDPRVAGKVKCISYSENPTGGSLFNENASYSSMVLEMLDGTFMGFSVLWTAFPSMNEGSYMPHRLVKGLIKKSILYTERNTIIVDINGEVWIGGYGDKGLFGEKSAGKFGDFVKTKYVFESPVDEMYRIQRDAVAFKMRNGKWKILGAPNGRAMMSGGIIVGEDCKLRTNSSFMITYAGTKTKMTSPIAMTDMSSMVDFKLRYDTVLKKVGITIGDIVSEQTVYSGNFNVMTIDMLVNKGFKGAIDYLKYTTNRTE